MVMSNTSNQRGNMAALLLAISIISQAQGAHGLGQTLANGGGQFITYEGTLGGSFTYADPNLKACGDAGTFYFPKEGNTTIRIGVNPPVWDSNLFYFELIREGLKLLDNPTPQTTAMPSGDLITTKPRPTNGNSRSLPISHPSSAAFRRQHPDSYLFGQRRRDDGDIAERQVECESSEVGHCTLDTIFNLDFQSTFYKCFKDGKQCGNAPAAPFDSLVVQMLDLNKAKTMLVNERLTISDGGPYYSLYGNESTWAGKGTSDSNSFDSQTPRNYSGVQSSACPHSYWPKMIWNNTTPFSYALNFTNITTLATFTITAPSFGTFVLSFEGMRVDADDGEHDPALADNPALEKDGEASIRYAAMSLASPVDHPDGPHFTFANGTEFYFAGTRASANLTGNETSSTSLAPGWKQTAWMGGGVGAWVGGCLFALAWAVLLC